jgi:CHASE2 domain-containing sensor protein
MCANLHFARTEIASTIPLQGVVIVSYLALVALYFSPVNILLVQLLVVYSKLLMLLNNVPDLELSD